MAAAQVILQISGQKYNYSLGSWHGPDPSMVKALEAMPPDKVLEGYHPNVMQAYAEYLAGISPEIKIVHYENKTGPEVKGRVY